MRVPTRWMPEGLKAPLRRLRRSVRSALHPWVPMPVTRAENPFATHIPVLVGLARLFPIRKVLELGSGEHSTLTFLDRRAFPDLDVLSSFEDDPVWKSKVEALVGDDSRVTFKLVEGLMADAVREVDLASYDLIFIDDSVTTDQRAATIRTVADKLSGVQVAVIHDFETPAYQHAAERAPFRLCFGSMNPNTGLVCRGLPVSESALRRLHALIEKHARGLDGDDFARWSKVFDLGLPGQRRPGGD